MGTSDKSPSFVVFYSWQNDTDKVFNKHFIRDALKIALKRMKKDEGLYPAPRLDQDTKNVTGTPEIASTIFNKIRTCSVFVADVTFSGTVMDSEKQPKQTPNANVLLELGYALHCPGSEQIVCVMNKHFGDPKQLPFDLRHRRWPLCYSLDDSATKEDIQSACTKLGEQLEDAIHKIDRATEAPASSEASGVAEATPDGAKQLEHDSRVFRAGDAVLPEQKLWYILSRVEVDHSYYLDWSCALDDFLHFLSLEQNRFLDQRIVECAEKLAYGLGSLLFFFGRNFFVFPQHRQDRNTRYCMHPRLNYEREGCGAPDESPKYSVFKDELDDHIATVREAYRTYRRAVKQKLFV